jgi:protein-arginine kinase activator protein McsA
VGSLSEEKIICNHCGKNAFDQYLTQINPEGGYGRKRWLVCDDCMRPAYDHWIEEHWPNWPNPRDREVVDG